MQKSIFPVLSSSVHGPLGIKHLPRLWLKILLHGCGTLPEGYRYGAGGFDEFLTTTLGIDREALVAYICEEKPDYLALEAWVRSHATKLGAESIAAVNAKVDTADLPEPMRAERLSRFNITDPTYTKAVALNDLDDWAGMHEAITGTR
ncbi:MAG: hypothetical protein NVSMB5_22280 [Candidatus Velthaea sp.]